MGEQINFYAVQRGTLGSFKPSSDGVMYLYLYINIHTDIGRRPETNFGCSLCKSHPCNELCFAHFHAEIQNILKILRYLLLQYNDNVKDYVQQSSRRSLKYIRENNGLLDLIDYKTVLPIVRISADFRSFELSAL